jgi:O-antigen/teichoic acid export membrane protein
VSDPLDAATAPSPESLLAAAVPEDVLDTGEAGGKVIRGGVLRTASYGVGIALATATVPLMTRHLGQDAFGQFVLASSVVMIVGGVTEAGLTAIGMREYAVRAPDARRTMLAQLLGLRLALTVAGVAIALAVLVAFDYPTPVVEGTLITGVGVLLMVAQQSYSIPLTGRLQWGWMSAIETMRNAITAVLVVLLVLTGAGLVSFFFVSVVAAVAVLAATLPLVLDDVSLLPRFGRATWSELVRDALPYAAAASIGVVYFRISLLLLGGISTGKATGDYSTAFKVVETLGGIAWIIVQSSFPLLTRAARDDQERLRYALGRVFDVSLILGVWFSLCVVVGAPLAIHVVGGSAFESAIPVLRIQGLSLAATFLVATWAFALLSLHRYRDLLVSNALALVLAVALGLSLIPEHAAEGAAIASVGAEFALAVGYAVLLFRARPDLRLPLRTVPPVLLATGAGALIGLLVPAPSIVLLVLCSAAFFGILLAFRAVPAEIAHALLRRR